MLSGKRFNGVKVFSATMARDRDDLGEKMTAWLAAHPAIDVADVIVTQSSDASFHCIAITVFYNYTGEAPRRRDHDGASSSARRLSFKEEG